jgi:hypothetical protein
VRDLSRKYGDFGLDPHDAYEGGNDMEVIVEVKGGGR